MKHLVRSPLQLGGVIKRIRKLKQLTQSELGQKINMRQATLSNLESGLEGVKLGTLLNVLAALDSEIIIQPRTVNRRLGADKKP